MQQVKIPKIQYVIYIQEYKKYVGRYNYTQYIQEAKIYKSLDVIKDAINQIKRDSFRKVEYKVQEIETILVSAEEWKHEEYLVSKARMDEYHKYFK